MHELLAPVLFVLAQAKTECPEGVKEPALLSSSEFVAHDAYFLFERIMKTTSDWFHTKPSKVKDEDEWVDPEDQVSIALFLEPMFTFLDNAFIKKVFLHLQRSITITRSYTLHFPL